MMTHDEAIAYLMEDGDLAVPCSRYGRCTSDCAEVCWLAAEAFADATGEEIQYGMLDHLMGLVVNDHDDIAHLVNSIEHDWAADAAEESAEKLGAEAGQAAASWFEYPTERPGLERLVRGLDDIEPEIMDCLPWLDLSGEWADGPDERSILAEILDDADASADPDPDALEITFSLVDAYREAYDEAVLDAIGARANELLDDCDPWAARSEHPPWS